jgi:hypothetical protein
MSGVNGDKARFNRRRKHKIHRRAGQQAKFGALFKPAEPTVPRSEGKSKEKSA